MEGETLIVFSPGVIQLTDGNLFDGLCDSRVWDLSPLVTWDME
jgi:hypothetical protein